MKRLLCLAILAAQIAPAQQSLYTFRNDLWVNLHHFLYLLGRARMATIDSGRDAVRPVTQDVEGMDALDKPEFLAWDAAIDYYKGTWSPKDAVFDEDLVKVTRAVAEYPKDVPAELRAVLERAAPVYRKVWWPRHDRANREKIAELETLLAAHGKPIAAAVAKAWGQKWPVDPVTVNIAAYANWAGAYSTDGGLIVFSSKNSGNAGTLGLEILFHETMHQWDDDFIKAISRSASAAKVPTPRNLSHSLIFFTAGYAVAAECPGHKPYADAGNMWGRGSLFPRERIAAEWVPYLEGKRRMEEALGSLVRPVK